MNNLPFGVIVAGLAVGLGVLAVTSDESPEFDPSKSAVVTNLQVEDILKDDFYINAQYMGKTVPAHLKLEQCDDTEPPICAKETVNLNKLDPIVVSTIAVGNSVVLAEISK